MTAIRGYFRYPCIAGDTVVFCCEDDLWAVSAAGGSARRLSANPGRASFPSLSPDGAMLAFASEDEGATEVYVMPMSGGSARRLTFTGGECRVVGWRGDAVVFASSAAQPHRMLWHLWEVPSGGGAPRMRSLGPALSVAHQPEGPGQVLWRNSGGRSMGDPAWWKRYRGGRAGQLWIDRDGEGEFDRLIDVAGDMASPMWLGERVFFLADHDGVGNIYSCTATGADLTRHTDHSDYYVRTPTTDGARIVYACGADLYLLDPAEGTRPLEVTTASSRPQRNRRFVTADRYLLHFAVHPEGHSLCVTARGKPFSFGLWEGAVLQHGDRDGVRYRLARWLPDGVRLLATTDASGEEQLALIDGADVRAITTTEDIGRIVVMEATSDRVGLANNRNEVWVVELESGAATRVARCGSDEPPSLSWSPDGRWLAYTMAVTENAMCIEVYGVEDGTSRRITRPEFRDYEPRFDPSGRYLYFLSLRAHDPVYDQQVFDLGFPRGGLVMAVALTPDAPSPFEPVPREPGCRLDRPREPQAADEPVVVDIDFDGIEDRVVAAPIPEGRFSQLRVVRDRLLFTSLPVEGSLGQAWRDLAKAPPAKARIECYDLRDHEQTTWVDGVTEFEVSANGSALVVRSGWRLRAVSAVEKPEPPATDKPGRSTGIVDLSRVKLSIEPGAEWRQMVCEAWRLQRDHFWREDMQGVDWPSVLTRYLPLVERVATRAELSDLLWEMQGELGTSHAYEFGGDYGERRDYRQGHLGADFAFDDSAGCWRVERVLRGDSWTEHAAPLAAPGVGVRAGDRVIAVAGRRLGRDRAPAACLVHHGGDRVTVTVADRDGGRERTVTVRALDNEQPLRYRDWVERNRAHVHAETGGQVGYVHIPDMGPAGFAEFHRYFRVECERAGLIVDARHNGGGHVSPLIVEKLLRRRVAHFVSRWSDRMMWPAQSVAGPVVGLTNENAGSDGDMFSWAFRELGIGPMIGTRTWGGVVGIFPRYVLVDHTVTTQPEYAFQACEDGHVVENRGVDPDITIDNRPQDYAAGRDRQIDRAIAEAVAALESR